MSEEERDEAMKAKGYCFKLIPLDKSFEPLYSKTFVGVSCLLRSYEDTKFEIRKLH